MKCRRFFKGCLMGFIKNFRAFIYRDLWMLCYFFSNLNFASSVGWADNSTELKVSPKSKFFFSYLAATTVSLLAIRFISWTCFFPKAVQNDSKLNPLHTLQQQSHAVQFVCSARINLVSVMVIWRIRMIARTLKQNPRCKQRKQQALQSSVRGTSGQNTSKAKQLS